MTDRRGAGEACRGPVSPRDLLVTQRVLQGESCRQVAEDFGIGGARARQIAVWTVQRLYPYAQGVARGGLRRLRHVHAMTPLL